MSEPGRDRPSFSEKIGKKEERRQRARRERRRGLWFGLGMLGIVGWSVVVPALLFTALGAWLDRKAPGSYSWTLTLMIAGLVLGCLNAWYWVKKSL